MKAKLFKVLPLFLALSLILAACSGNDEKGKEKKTSGASGDVEQVLNLTETAEIPSMDTTQATDTISFDVMNNVFEGLYRLDKDNKPVPGVAQKVEISDDQLTYTFHLNPNAKWSNGEKVTANDFVYAWRKVLDPDTLSEYAYILGDIKNANEIMDDSSPIYGKVEDLGVKAIDDQTLEVKLKASAPYFLGLTAFPTFFPQNQKFVEEQGDKYALEVSNMIYNGPFVLNQWDHEEKWQYKKNETYWDKENVKLNEINVHVIKDIATGVNLYETNTSDKAVLTAEFVDNYKDNPDFHTMLDSSVFFLRLNEKNKALANVKIRKAIDRAWNKKALADVVLNDGSVEASYLVPKDFVSDANGEDFRKANGNFGKLDPAEAKKLWEEGLKEIGMKSVKLELLISDTGSGKQVGEHIKSELEKNLPGIEISLKAQPFKQKLKLESDGDYDMSYAGWGPDYQDPMTFLDLFVTNGAHNQMNYSNKKYDQLIADAKNEKDTEKRWEIMLEAEKVLFEDQAIAPMFQDGAAYLQKKKVKNIYNHLFGASHSYKWAYISK